MGDVLTVKLEEEIEPRLSNRSCKDSECIAIGISAQADERYQSNVIASQVGHSDGLSLVRRRGRRSWMGLEDG